MCVVHVSVCGCGCLCVCVCVCVCVHACTYMCAGIMDLHVCCACKGMFVCQCLYGTGVGVYI